MNNPVWHIHHGQPPASHMVVSFAMLLNLASVAGAMDKEGLWGFIRRYAPDASPETHPDLDAAAGYALRYFADFVAPTRAFRAARPTRNARRWQDLRARLAAWDGGRRTHEALQTMVFAVGTRARLRPAARLVHGALRGAARRQSQGPRFGGFIALYGVDETVALIDAALVGELGA